MADEVFQLQGSGAETANRHRRPIECQRRDDRVDAAAVGEAGVHHRAGLIDPAADHADDSVDDLPKVLIVAEADVHRLEAALCARHKSCRSG